MVHPFVRNIPAYVFMVLFAGLCVGTIFAVSGSFIDTRTLPKWYAFALGLSLVLVAMAVAGRKGRDLVRRQFYLLLLIVAAACMAQAAYGILQYFYILPAFGKLRITGSFDNPAGLAAALCAGLPFAVLLWSDCRKWVKYTAASAAILIAAAVILSGSRAGIVSAFVIAVLWTFGRIRNKTVYRRVLLIVLPALLVGLYFLKKDSADGRLLIWRNSMEMVADKPVFGHGPGGFAAGYMNYQADYFRQHPDSPYAQLADTVHHPFNEYLLVAVDYGLFGLIVLGALAYLVVCRYRRQDRQDPAIRAAGLCLVAIGVFALFSYPFLYPFTWVMALFSLWIIFGRPWPAHRAVRVVAVLTAVTVSGLSLLDMRCQLDWYKANRMSLTGDSGNVLSQYRRLQGYFAHDRYFLYNYAGRLGDLGRYDESLAVARDCSRIWADYYLQLMMADNCMKMQRYGEAEGYFLQAAAMCPARFMPLYQLTKIYMATGRTGEARALAGRILDKEIKVPSTVVYAIRHEMRQLIDTTANTTIHQYPSL